MKPRFYSDQPIDPAAVDVTLEGPEHQHLSKVLRLRAGDEVQLFDGSGREFAAVIRECGRNASQLQIESCAEVDRELSFPLTLGVALPKGDRQQWLVEKCVELGVTKLTPLVTTRGVAQPHEKALVRLQKWIINASKQCRRNRLMQVTPAETVDQFFARGHQHTVLVMHPETHPQSAPPSVKSGDPSPIYVGIGPEGGFSDDEIDLARNSNCQLVSLGDRILRIETAALATVAALVYGERLWQRRQGEIV